MNTASPPPSIQDNLNLRPTHQGRWLKWMLWLALLLALIAAAIGWLRHAQQNVSTPKFVTESVSLGSLVIKVSATGNLEPINQVDVGSELSGMIEAVLVDNNDTVTQGQVLARLDSSRSRDQANKSKAALTSSQAQVAQAVATVTETRNQLERLRNLSKKTNGQMVSVLELNTAEAALARAVAGEAVARAGVAQALATLNSDETNLDKTVIRSPINGVVLAREVEPGQTVAASLQAPVLFTLAEDLAHMELHVDVDEADVGQVKIGQTAIFSVDAWRNRRYPAVITRVNFGSEVTDGVVTYPTVLEVNNDDLTLRPGMTATAEITTVNRENVVLVPNAALRFSPALQAAKDTPQPSLISSLVPKPPRDKTSGSSKKTASPDGMQTLHILRDGQAVAIKVKTGLTDGKVTEIIDADLKPGTPVIIEQRADKS